MSSPKEKAEELLNKYYTELKEHKGLYDIETAKQCALIAIDEIKEQLITNLSNDISGIHAIYWEKVKQKIEKL